MAISAVESLQSVLASSFVLYFKTHSFHWNVEGRAFFDLHDKFEELYTAHFTVLDEIAERIRALDVYAPTSIAALVEKSAIAEENTVADSEKMVAILVQDYARYIALLKETLSTVPEDDDTTITLLSDLLAASEKTRWMLGAYSRI